MESVPNTTDEDPVCLCGDPIEEIDGGGVTYWAHVERMFADYDHSAVPARPDVRIAEAVGRPPRMAVLTTPEGTSGLIPVDDLLALGQYVATTDPATDAVAS